MLGAQVNHPMLIDSFRLQSVQNEGEISAMTDGGGRPTTTRTLADKPNHSK
jgi:hypothetical protein